MTRPVELLEPMIIDCPSLNCSNTGSLRANGRSLLWLISPLVGTFSGLNPSVEGCSLRRSK